MTRSKTRIGLFLALLLLSLWALYRADPPRRSIERAASTPETPAPQPIEVKPAVAVGPAVLEQHQPGPPRISGDVFDESTGRPVGDASVELLREPLNVLTAVEQRLEIEPLARAVSDKDGRYSIEAEPGYYFLRASATGYPRRHSGPFTFAPSATRPAHRIPLRAAGELHVTVMDPAGKPMRGVRVEIRSWRTEWRYLGLAHTGEDGTAVESVPWGTDYAILARSAAGLEVGTRDVGVDAAGRRSIELRYSGGVELRGLVADQTGRPIEGVKITAMIRSSRGMGGRRGSVQSGGTTRSDGQGAFRFEVPNERLSLTFLLPGYADVRQEVEDPGAAGFMKVVMNAGATIRGQIREARNGAAIVGARVTREGGQTAVTDDSGRYELIVGLDAGGKAALLARADGYLTNRKELEGLEAGGSRNDVDFELSAGISVRGVVLNATDRSPIPGALAKFRSEGDETPAFADAAGQFELIAGGPTGMLEVSATGFGTEMLQLKLSESGAADPLEFRLQPNGSISGHVRDLAGQPVSGATIDAYTASFPRGGSTSTLSLADGTYRMDAVPTGGECMVRATHPEYAVTMVDCPPLRPGAQLSGVDLVLARGGGISGSVVDEQDSPVANITVSASPASRNLTQMRRMRLMTPASVQTGADGRFELTTIPAGSHLVSAEDSSGSMDAEETVGVAEGRVTSGVRLVLRKGAEIRGRVTDELGNPVRGVALSVTPTSMTRVPRRGGGMYQDVRTDEKGQYTIKGLTAESYEVSASAEDRNWSDERTVRAPADGVDFVVDATAIVEGRVLTAKGREPVKEFRAGLTRASSEQQSWGMSWPGREPGRPFSSESGSFRFDKMSAGLFDLTVHARGYAPGLVRGLRLESGKTLGDVQVLLSPGASISGVVLDEAGSEIAGAQIHVLPPGEDQPWRAMIRRRYEAAVLSDARGGFRIDGLAAGSIELEASHDDYLSGSLRIELREAEAREGVDLRLRRGASIRGTVVWRRSRGPAFGAGVSVSPGGGPAAVFMRAGPGRGPGNAIADANGSFELKGVPFGHQTLRIQRPRPSQVTVQKSIEVSGDIQDLEIELDDGTGTIAGRVLDASSKPVSEAIVFGKGGEAAMLNAITDTEGRFTFEGLGHGLYRISAMIEADGGDRAISREVTLEEGGKVEVTLQPDEDDGATLSGTVRRADGGPVGGYQLSLMPPADIDPLDPGGLLPAQAAVREDGGYQMTSVRAGSYRVRIDPPGLNNFCGSRELAEWAVVMTGEDQRRDFEIPAAIDVRGTVRTRDKAPLAGARVASRDAIGPMLSCFAESDRDGNYVLRGLSPGTVVLQARADGHGAEQVEVRISGSGEMRQDFVLRPSGAVWGRVVDAGGDLVTSAWLDVRRLDGTQVRTVRLVPDEDGRYEVTGLVADRYLLSARTLGLAPSTVGPVVAGGETTAEVNFRLGAGGSLRVLVNDTRGAPVVGQPIVIRRVFEGQSWAVDVDVRTDASGVARVAALEAAVYRIRAQRLTPGGPEQEVEVREGQASDVELKVE